MYNITVGDKATPGNELGIFEDLGDVYSQTDLNLFFTTLYPYVGNILLADYIADKASAKSRTERTRR